MQVYGADIVGIEGCLVRFTATVEQDRQGVKLLGLTGKVVKEGLARAMKAIETLDEDWSSVMNHQGYTISLDLAETPKTSSGLDLPLAIILLQAGILQNPDTLREQMDLEVDKLHKAERRADSLSEQRLRLINERVEQLVRQREKILKYRDRLKENKRKYLLIGTLDIATGRIGTPEYGMFGMVAAAKPGFTLIVSEDSECYAAIVANRQKGIQAFRAADLQEVWNTILGTQTPKRARKERAWVARRPDGYAPDLRAIEGVSRAKRAMTVAFAGGHNILLVGPPGQGKTMLSEAATELLPDLSQDEMLEVNMIHSAKGELAENEVIVRRPFRKVQSAGVTPAALFGGGHTMLFPGEISLAHKGVLLLDEINLCDPGLIEKLRNTLNDRVHRVQRVRRTTKYPCNFMLVASMNPCKCGWYEHYVCPICRATLFGSQSRCPDHPSETLNRKCNCAQRQVETYRSRLSRPLLDRIDLKVFVSAHDHTEPDAARYASSTVKNKIKAARVIQQERYAKETQVALNADIKDKALFRELTPPLSTAAVDFLDRLNSRLDNKRIEVKVLLVARTVADLEGAKSIRRADVSEAVDLMGLNHEYFRAITR